MFILFPCRSNGKPLLWASKIDDLIKKMKGESYTDHAIILFEDGNPNVQIVQFKATLFKVIQRKNRVGEPKQLASGFDIFQARDYIKKLAPNGIYHEYEDEISCLRGDDTYFFALPIDYEVIV